MPRNKSPEFFHPEIRRLIERALEDAWQELKVMRRARLVTTIVALAAIGETDSSKLKNFALNAAKATYGHKSAAQTF